MIHDGVGNVYEGGMVVLHSSTASWWPEVGNKVVAEKNSVVEKDDR